MICDTMCFCEILFVTVPCLIRIDGGIVSKNFMFSILSLKRMLFSAFNDFYRTKSTYLYSLVFLPFRKNPLSLAMWSLRSFFIYFLHTFSSLNMIVSVIDYILKATFLFNADMKGNFLKERALVALEEWVMENTIAIGCILNFLVKSVCVLHHFIIYYICYSQ